MKRHIYILVLACLVAACTPPVETHHGASPQTGDMMCQTRHGASLPTDDMHPRLAAIDSLMWQQPDSALAVLLDFAGSPLADSLDAFDGHYCQLLISELLYKNDCEQTNREDLLKAVVYFDSICISGDVPWRVSTHDVVFLDARAHYINGVGFYERDSIVPACQAYLKALQVMEGHFKDDELNRNMIRFMGLINSRLSELFFFNEGYAAAIETGKKMVYYFLKINDNERAINAYKNIGNCYSAILQNDSALFYMNKARKLAENVQLENYQYILRESASLYYDIKMADSAFMMAWQAMNLSVTRDDSLTNCFVLGEMYYREMLYDSAIFYLKQSINRNQFSTQLASAQLLKEAYEALGDMEQAAIYAQSYNKGLEKYLGKASDKAEIVSLYNAYCLQEQDCRHSAWRRKSIGRVMLGIGVLLVLLGLLAIYFVRRGRRHAEMMQQENDILREEKQKVEWERSKMSGRMRRANEMLKEKDGIIDEKNRENSLLKMRLEQQSADMPSFAEELICRQILDAVASENIKSTVDMKIYSAIALTRQQQEQLRMAVERHYGTFAESLKKTYPKLTNDDLNYCRLYLLGLSEVQIAALMQKSYPSVWERADKLKRIFGTDEKIAVFLQSKTEVKK